MKTATATPRANGQIERLNTLLLTCMSTTSNFEGDNLDERILDVQWAVNNSEHRVTKRTPYEIIFQKKGVGERTNPLTLELIDLNERMCVEEERPSVSKLLCRNRDKQKEYYVKHRKAPRIYKQGDIVLVLSAKPATGESRKLMPRYKAPYEIVKPLGRDRYLVQDIEGEKQSGRFYKAFVAVDKLKFVGSRESEKVD